MHMPGLRLRQYTARDFFRGVVDDGVGVDGDDDGLAAVADADGDDEAAFSDAVSAPPPPHPERAMSAAAMTIVGCRFIGPPPLHRDTVLLGHRDRSPGRDGRADHVRRGLLRVFLLGIEGVHSQSGWSLEDRYGLPSARGP
jgi:hypothetical protein